MRREEPFLRITTWGVTPGPTTNSIEASPWAATACMGTVVCSLDHVKWSPEWQHCEYRGD